ncbi:MULTISPECIES: hypothetical protein [Metallosphaera]|uniref:Uncharacterized protein n=3 Tax=Metallosphaera TaxID=41980 RepID=A4YDT9_METS5|nr:MULTISPECIES: hypothetical protein [Metallosphaera]ABP94591.1 hypothetical protein Msed_0414 [Metallosphaera sedula DSM 5348]AIM26578.1 hypothetical protein HA72_0414 [Metallosphaera sedula]AKV73560.1 hypothetical protein MsedA_0427 [Metallosphaera sedula]AKV75802.1 hypothetical protein MsedB_0427 [Metallosphaera sedula]AKV78050.1 hypothetical protein MsedC_0426 [Metallosphaera sedula]
MRVKSVNVEKSGIEFCYNEISVMVYLKENEMRIAEEITYEVATGPVVSNVQIVLRDGKVYLDSPFGQNVIENPANIVKGLREILEGIREKHPSVYEKYNEFLKAFQA